MTRMWLLPLRVIGKGPRRSMAISSEGVPMERAAAEVGAKTPLQVWPPIPAGEARRGLKNTKMTGVLTEVMRLDGATAENGWENDARESVTYADIHKVMEYTELERRAPQMRGPRRPWSAGEAKKFLTLWVLGLSSLKGEVFDSGRQRNATPPMYDLGWGVIRPLGSWRHGAVVVGIGEADLDVSVIVGAGTGQAGQRGGPPRTCGASGAAGDASADGRCGPQD
ncbi:hypothetical protein Emag_007187 [Eimeria magna]